MNSKLTTRQITATALMTALMCIFGPMSLQIGPIPVSLTNLVIYFAAYVLGAKGALRSYIIYFLLGFVGLPVFSGWGSGIGKITGPTGGCLIGFFITAFLAGLVAEKINIRVLRVIVVYLTTIPTYILSVLWYAYTTKTTLIAAFAVCVLPFILIDFAKAVICEIVAPVVKRRIGFTLNNDCQAQ
jgi:biotin transport system substrate-specific component